MRMDRSTYYYLKASTICLTIIAGGVVTAFLVYTKALMIPLVISIFFYTILIQFTLYLRQRFSLPKWLALTIAILSFAALFAVGIGFTANSVGSFLKGAETYRETVLASSKDLITSLNAHGISIDQHVVENYLSNLPLFDWLKNISGKAFHLLSNAVLVILFLTFFLFGRKKTPGITNPSIKAMLANVSIYLSVKLMASLITGVAVAAVLIGFSVKQAVLFALFAFLLNFIPSVGSIIAVLLPIPVLFLQFGISPTFVIIIILLFAIEFIIGNLVEPRFLGEGVDLHPAVVVASLIFWTLIWGIPGAFLSVPITASIKIVLKNIKYTQSAAEFLAGRLPK